MLELNELKDVVRASRYTGGEVGQVIKKGRIVCKSALVLPYPYEIAMADNTFRAMHYNLNKKRETSLERCFAVMPDFEEKLIQNCQKLYTLDTKTTLDNLDIIFTKLDSPLVYTTFFHMLDLAKIPLISEKRDEDMPVIIAGGEAATYPKPISKLIDVFIVGDMPRIAEQIVDKYVLCKKENKTKQEFLATLLRIEGVYIPSIHKEEKIYITYSKRLADKPMEPYQITPLVSTPMDAVNIELTMGCNRECNTCKHKYLYRGVEAKPHTHALTDIKRGVEVTGNKHINFMSNCFLDYDGLEDLAKKAQSQEKPKIENISFKDVMLTTENMWVIPYLKEQYKKSGEVPSILIGAPTEELRQVLGIHVVEEDILTVARKVFRAGFNKIKLKYMLGIPKENYEDLNNMFNLATKIIKIYTEEYSSVPDKYVVELDIQSFIPWPHTPLEFAAVNNYSKLQMKAKYLEERNKSEYVKLNFQDFTQSEILTLLLRGDNRMSDVICKAVELGANFDYMKQAFNFDIWHLAMTKFKIDTKAMLEEIDTNTILPWENITLSTDKDEFIKKYIEIMKGSKNENSSNQ